MFDTVIYDLDGTLIYSLPDLFDSVNYILNKYNRKSRSFEEVRSYVGNGLTRLITLAFGEELPHDFDDIVNEFKEYYAEHSYIKTRMYDGIGELIYKVHSLGIKTAVVTNKTDKAAQILHNKLFGQNIDFTIGEGQGFRRKPAPDGTLHAMNVLSSCKEKTLYIGDTEVDVNTAKAAGIKCCLVTWGFRDRDYLMTLDYDFIVGSAEELFDIIKFGA